MLWIYLSGVIVTMMLCFVFIYMDWRHGVDTKLGDILMYISLSLGSWATIMFTIAFEIVSFLNGHSKAVVIKGKNNDI